MDRKEQLDENMKKLYTKIFTVYCTTSMQQRLEEHPNFDKFEDDPIATLEVIRNTTHETICAQYPFVTIVDSIVRWMNARQGEDEDLITFTKRVKQLSDVVKSMIGTKILHDYVKGTDKYKNASPQEMIDQLDNSYKYLGAYVLLRGADRAKSPNSL